MEFVLLLIIVFWLGSALGGPKAEGGCGSQGCGCLIFIFLIGLFFSAIGSL